MKNSKKFILLLCLVSISFFLLVCFYKKNIVDNTSSKQSSNSVNIDKGSTLTSLQDNEKDSSSQSAVTKLEDSSQNITNSEDSSQSTVAESKDSSQNISNSEDSSQESIDIVKKTKEYILYGQDNPYGATTLNWNENFLDKVDINSVYQEYLTSGGTDDDIESFAKYLTLNAPILDDWQDLVISSVYNNYGVEIVRFEYMNDNLYTAYVVIDGSEKPYVTVNIRTGYYHG